MRFKAVLISLFILLIGSGLLAARFVLAVGGGGLSKEVDPLCTNDIWTCDEWSVCSKDRTQNRTCTLVDDCAFASTVESVVQECNPECLSDDYVCEDWGVCDANNKQTRLCYLRNDCINVEDPMPITEQTCKPTCNQDEWVCEPWSDCSLSGRRIRKCEKTYDCPVIDTAAPATSESCTPTCTEDSWSCGEWGECDTDGIQTRTCEFVYDCPVAQKNPPALSRMCARTQCADPDTLLARVKCRQSLNDQGIARELELNYMPEACAVLSADKQTLCVENYFEFQQCWLFPVGETRFKCARQVVGLNPFLSIESQKQDCNAFLGEEADTCLQEMRQKVYNLIGFYFYDLEERAEAFIGQGVDSDLVANEVVRIIEQKIAFSKATDYNGRLSAINSMHNEWDKFIEKVKEQIE